MRTKGVAALLAFLLGGIGGHKFYLGQHVQGVLYLLFCWTLIPMFIAFIEILVYLTMSDATFDQRYNASYLAPRMIHHQPQQSVTVNVGNQNVADELHKLNNLRMSGALSDAEFEAQKRRLLG